MNASFKAKILGKYDAQYEICSDCSFLRIFEPFWLEEAYSSAIASTDTGLVMRNFSIARKLAVMLFFVFGERGHGACLDAAGGYGLLTRLMRDYGFDFYWIDKYCSNLMARGFEFDESGTCCEVVTAFEVMEHLEDPLQFVVDVLLEAKSDTFIFSTELFDGEPPTVDQWWYYSVETGQHIGFFQKKTLKIMAKKLDMHFFSAGGIHVFTKRNISSLIMSLSVSRLNVFFAPMIRRILGSRLMIDNQLMINKLKNIKQVGK
jgi:hypothetical protein